MEIVEEYQKVALLAANVILDSRQRRPAHIINITRIKADKLAKGKFASLFEELDDGSLTLRTLAQTVGARASRESHESREPAVIIV